MRKKQITDTEIMSIPIPETSISQYTENVRLLPPDHELNQPQVWHRQDGEPFTAYQYFKVFLRLGEGLAKVRNLKLVAGQIRRAESYVYHLSFTYKW